MWTDIETTGKARCVRRWPWHRFGPWHVGFDPPLAGEPVVIVQARKCRRRGCGLIEVREVKP